MPQPNYNQDTCYWCSKYMIDIELDSDACETNGGMSNTCASCVFCEKQNYSIVIQREDQKEFISPKETLCQK